MGSHSLLTSSESTEALGLLFAWGKGCSNCSRNGRAAGFWTSSLPFPQGKVAAVLVLCWPLEWEGQEVFLGREGSGSGWGWCCSLCQIILCSMSCAKAEQLESTCAVSRDQSTGKVGAERGGRTVPCTAESGKKCSLTPEPSHWVSLHFLLFWCCTP